jgi:G3E family GTPase
MSNPRIKLYLLTGFLGAGKTTVLKRIIDHLQTSKIGILMNEFGSISVDGVLLQQHGVDIVEINNGSVFCSCLKGAFIDALIAYSELPIQYLFVETSGMADPSNIEPILTNVIGNVKGKSYDYRGSICLVDGANFLEQVDVLAALERQVAASNLVIVNKADLVSEEELGEVQEKVRQLNPEAELVTTCHGAVALDFLERELQPVQFSEAAESCNTPFNRPTAHVITAEGIYDQAGFNSFIEALVPWAMRMKGFFLLDDGWHQVDVVGGQIDIRLTSIPRTVSELVVISDKGFQALTAIYGCWDERFAERKITIS